LKEIGIKQIYIQPDQNPGSGVLADKWIPIKAQTDCALMAAIAYIWITENTYDQDYIETHSVGFDLWKAYILGESEDMIPKTPQWASPLCGVPTWTIKALARQWANKSTSLIHQFHGLGFTRGPYGTRIHKNGSLSLCHAEFRCSRGKPCYGLGIMPSPEKPINVARGNGGAAIAGQWPQIWGLPLLLIQTETGSL
jgi:predicted molibdopterin-dependent oxidoreductase YjgC